MHILLVDDHTLFREGLQHVLQALADPVFISHAASYQEALTQLKTQGDLDLVLVDLQLPDRDGFELLAFIRERYPALPAVVVSATVQRSCVNKAIEMGALGYIEKNSTSQRMLHALQLILSGGIYLPPYMLQSDTNTSSVEQLTPRQRDVLALISAGKSNKNIAADLGLSEATVKMHVTAIMKTLGVNNRTQAALKFNQLEV